MNKGIKYTYGGMNQDITKSKHDPSKYFDAQHIRVVATSEQSTGSVTNEKGTLERSSLPSITISQSTNSITYGTEQLSYTNNNEIDNQVAAGDLPTSSSAQQLIGQATTRTGFVLFSTDDLGMDCVWKVENAVEGIFTLELIYVRSMGFSSSNPIQALYNYENDNIQKVYWVDGVNQIRNLNLTHESIEGNGLLIDVPVSSINLVGTVNYSQPLITEVLTGGNHTAGMVQYAYNLYRLNSSQTKISPLSELVPLANEQGGAEVNTAVDTVPVVQINNIDTSYDYIKVYAIKYTSLNAIPSIALIDEREISSNGSLTVYDDGNVKNTLTLEEFAFLGSDPIVPQHIAVKDNRLFPANITTKPFILPDLLDCRAYSYNISSSSSIVWDNVFILPSGTVTGVRYPIADQTSRPPKNHDAVNIEFDTRKYRRASTALGASGKYVSIEIVQKSVDNPEEGRFLKDQEIYRIGIEFYNTLGQTSLPQWICDYKMPSGNLEGNYNTIKLELEPAFYTDFVNVTYADETQRPVGYRLLIAQRTEQDKTIIAQGILTPMMFQVLGDEAKNFNQFTSYFIRQNFQDGAVKMPSFLTRNFQKIPNSSANDNNGVLLPTRHLAWLNDDPNNDQDEGGEVYTVTNDEKKISQTFQHSRMMQMYTPEATFDLPSNFSAGEQLRVKGLCENTLNGSEVEARRVDTQEVEMNGKTEGGLNPFRVPSSEYIENNSFRRAFRTPEGDNENNDRRFIGTIGLLNESMPFHQYYRQFNNFLPDSLNKSYKIYGQPEKSQRGADTKSYNNDPNFRYTNSLVPFTSDGEDTCDTCDLITSINSYNSDCVTMVLGNPNDSTTIRTSLEMMYNQSNLSEPNGALLAEITRSDIYPFTGSMYGGITYEDKKQTTYVGVGSYTDVNTTEVQVDNAGDTYIQLFRFLRINKTDTEIYDRNQMQITEVVEFPVETIVDLKNRHDISFGGWDGRFQPREEEFHKYNTVYSQQSNLITTEDTPLTFRRVDNFDTRIQSTKVKIPNESIDSWTDILVNETMDLSGKFGPINNIIEFQDELYTFQDEAIAKILINPNVQIQASDGVGVELGTGNILYDFKYLTTRSGAVNKWGIITGKSGIYYYDLLNKGIGRVPDGTSLLLSDAKGLHTKFNSEYDYSLLSEDNPFLQKGVIAGVDNYNNDIFFTLHQGDKSFTVTFNELMDEYIDFKKYTPISYLYRGERLFGLTSTAVHEHYVGDYNVYYGTNQPSYITLLVNPEQDIDTIINNIHYASEVYLNGIDQPNVTLTHIRVYNEYQDSGRIPLVEGRRDNLRRRFREWKASAPRDGRNRLRNPWNYLTLEFQNLNNYNLILHDMKVYYTV